MVQPPFDGGQGEREEFGDAGEGPLLEIAQMQHDLKLRLQFGQSLSELGAVAFEQQSGFRAGHQRRAVSQDQGIEPAVFRRLMSRLLPADPPCSMPCDGAYPAPEVRRILELRQRLERQKESILSQIFGGLPRAKALHGDEHDSTSKPAHQFVERVHVSQQRVQNQRLNFDLRITALSLCHSFHSSCREEASRRAMDRRGRDFFTGRSGSRSARSAFLLFRYVLL